MENLTHSLLGATLAELALPADATPAQRRIFFNVGIIAANLPDADLLYTRITEPPLGYLIHHRGHTHTIGGLIVQAILMAAVCMLPAIARRVGPARTRLWSLIALGLLSHLVADSWNSYGVHPFWPFDARWVYGDSIFIAEPWLWLLLGVAAVWNARNRRMGVGVGLLLVVPLILATVSGTVPIAAFVALVLCTVAAAVAARHWPAPRRSATALAGVALFVGAMFAAREVVHAEVVHSLQLAPSARLLDVVLSPQPGNPLCWTALSVVVDESADAYTMTRGDVSLWLSTARCFMKQQASVEWSEVEKQSLSHLRALARDDCWVHPWLQFGRAPIIGERDITDMRYGGTSRGNFSSMPLGSTRPTGDCPANLTAWRPPRADLLLTR